MKTTPHDDRLLTELAQQLAAPLLPLLESAEAACLNPIPPAGLALLACGLHNATGRSVVWITDGAQTLETAHQDLAALFPEWRTESAFFPPREVGVGSKAGADPELTGHRLRTLLSLSHSPPRMLTTCIHALMQKTLLPAELRNQTRLLRIAEEQPMEALVEFLVAHGYAHADEVDDRLQFSVRGGILDVWPATELWPVRMEFLGPILESMRRFDPATQRSIDKIAQLTLAPATEESAASGPHAAAGLLDYLPDHALFLWDDRGAIEDHAALLEELTAESGDRRHIFPFGDIDRRISALPDRRQLIFGTEASMGSRIDAGIAAAESVLGAPPAAVTPDASEAYRKRVVGEIDRRAHAGHRVVLFFDTEAARDRFLGNAAEGAVTVPCRVGSLSSGVVSEATRTLILAEGDLYGRRRRIARRYDPLGGSDRPDRATGLRAAELTNIEPGDLVVHLDHGIGRYQGAREILFNGKLQEVLTIEYAEGAKLHLPISQAHLLTRYVGLARRRVELHRLGGRRWNADRQAAEDAIVDLASSLLETQAQRNALAGYAFPPDVPWQHDMEAAFPYQETPDQHRVIREVKDDLMSSRPMDRLICGDAGYGKTEIAMRAAFKTVMAGRQVAVLVPTTVLAQQHHDTFRERLSAFPVRIEMLSRFVGRARHAAILRGMAEGTVDIVVGTHALLQPGVEFKNLGLVVIDEEQRFGVLHKERFKELRRLVDVLTLTATPIPRTLYLGMTGARDMSVIQTPPRERMAIETLVGPNTDKTVREAILRELNREGQVYYLHNRVQTIDLAHRRLAELVPEARIDVAHGQMPAAALAAVMRRFVSGEINVLLCTTIIESGMDIPRANTILIDRADRFGIADLYQLRGRVGRSSQRAYAYLLLPPHGHIDADARHRIRAIHGHSGLSAGFDLALKDLELRGAGNLLGAAQSGHITTVGFGLYCQLLRATVSRLKGEPSCTLIDVNMDLDFVESSTSAGAPEARAMIPFTYIEDERLRIAVYRRIAEAATDTELDALATELTDRYGPPPEPVTRLLTVARVRMAAAQARIQSVEVRDGKLMMKRRGEFLQRAGRFPRLTGATADAQLAEIRDHIRAFSEPAR